MVFLLLRKWQSLDINDLVKVFEKEFDVKAIFWVMLVLNYKMNDNVLSVIKDRYSLSEAEEYNKNLFSIGAKVETNNYILN